MDETIKRLEKAKKITPSGGEYWTARDIQHLLGYQTWENFRKVIDRAIATFNTIKRANSENPEAANMKIEYHFLETTKMIDTGKGAQLAVEDFFVDRYACYLIAMNGDSTKPEIASSQTYFAVQTRRQEISDKLTLQDEEDRRLEVRNRVKDAVKDVNSTAKACGVVNFGYFHDAGYKGLYGMGLKAIKLRKGIGEKEDLMDRASREELAANEFRYTQTKARLDREKINNARSAENVHNAVGHEVRAAIKRIGGTLPEDMPAEPSLKQIEAKKKKNAPGQTDLLK